MLFQIQVMRGPIRLNDRMLYLIDETRDRLAIVTDDTRDRLALSAGETRERVVDASEGLRLRAAETLEFARGRVAIVLGVLAAVIAGGFLVAAAAGGEGSAPQPPARTADATTSIGPELVQERGFSLSLPGDWIRTDAPEGAVFSAESDDGAAQTTLWVERNSNLDFDGFVQQSLGGLVTLGEGARVTDRVDGPTIESSSAELRAEVPLNGMPPGPYRVNLRAAGPYRYYLATSIEPGASPKVLADAELLGSSLRPEVRVEGVDTKK